MGSGNHGFFHSGDHLYHTFHKCGPGPIFLKRLAEKFGDIDPCAKSLTSTFDDNEVAKNLYNSLGYRIVGLRKNHFNMPKGLIDELLMEKELIG